MSELHTVWVPEVVKDGTGSAQLTSAYEAALDALQVALKAVQDTKPNIRDYPRGEDVYNSARKEHIARVLAVNNVMNEIDAILWGIDLGESSATAHIDSVEEVDTGNVYA